MCINKIYGSGNTGNRFYWHSPVKIHQNCHARVHKNTPLHQIEKINDSSPARREICVCVCARPATCVICLAQCSFATMRANSQKVRTSNYHIRKIMQMTFFSCFFVLLTKRHPYSMFWPNVIPTDTRRVRVDWHGKRESESTQTLSRQSRLTREKIWN